MLLWWRWAKMRSSRPGISSKSASPTSMMATAADTVIVEPQEIVATGAIAPENVKTPGIFVDFIIKK